MSNETARETAMEMAEETVKKPKKRAGRKAGTAADKETVKKPRKTSKKTSPETETEAGEEVAPKPVKQPSRQPVTAGQVSKLLRIQNPALCERIAKASEILGYDNGDSLYAAIDQQACLLFLMEGAARSFYVDKKAKQHTMGFFVSPGYPLVSAVQTEVDFCQWDAVGDMKALCIPALLVAQLLMTEIEILWFYNRMLNYAFWCQSELTIVLRQSTPQQRYKWFLERFPGVDDYALGRDVATFLGITPETLSRVRKTGVENCDMAGLMYDVTRLRDSLSIWGELDKKQYVE